MPKFLPERPLYSRERLIVGYPVFAVFLLLFLTRLFGMKLPLPTDSLLFKLICELIVFLLPTLLFLFTVGVGTTRRMRLHAPHAMQIPFLIAALFVLTSGCMLLSILCGGTSSLGNSATVFQSVSAANPWQALLMVPVLAILPAVLEELFFRGVLIAEYERRGAIRAVIMSALLFSLCHFDLRNLPVYLFSGLLFALALLATDSLVATVILHAIYNTLSLFSQRYLNAFYEFTGSLELFLFLLVLVFLVALIFLCRAAAKLYRLRIEAGLGDPRRAVPRHVQLYTTLDALTDPPILLCLVLSVVGFIVL